MDSLTTTDVGEQLIRDLAEILPGSRDKRWRCPTALRARVVAYAKGCRDRGEMIEDVAARLGLVGGTVARWLRREREEMAAGFRSVAIVAAEESAVTEDRPMRLISTRGYCVENE
jgi:hypothetical protein